MERCFKQAVFYNVMISENACGDQSSTMEWKNSVLPFPEKSDESHRSRQVTSCCGNIKLSMYL